VNEENKELVRTLGRICVGEGMNVGKTIEAVTSSVMMVIHILGVVHDSNKTVQVCISFIPQNQTQMC